LGARSFGAAVTDAGLTVEEYDAILTRSVQQLANRGIVLRGDIKLYAWAPT
jgi:hypothetical protein